MLPNPDVACKFVRASHVKPLSVEFASYKASVETIQKEMYSELQEELEKQRIKNQQQEHRMKEME